MTSYGYDAASRLASLSQDLGGAAHDLSLTFAYNPDSQIVSNTRSNDLYAWTGHGTGTTGSTANGLNQLTQTGGTAITHDGRGNVTGIGGATYSYDAENRMIGATGAPGYLFYEPTGRLGHVYNGRINVYDGQALITEYNGGPFRRFVHGPGVDEPLVWYEGSGTSDKRYLHADERGSIVAVSDIDGNVVGINKYDEYGKPAAGNIGRFGYTGQAYVPEIGLYYYKARMYDPGRGRFPQTDPIGYVGGPNLYNAMGGDPVNLSDPSGLCSDGKGKYVSAPTGSRICGGSGGGHAAGGNIGIAPGFSGSSTAGPGGWGGATFGEAYQAANQRFGGYGSAAVNAAADYLMGKGSLGQVAANARVPSRGGASVQLAGLLGEQGHEYFVGPYLICRIREAGCNSETLRAIFPSYVVPNLGQPVSDGQISPVHTSFGGYVGDVLTSFSSGGLSATNFTLPGHIFHKGQVDIGNFMHSGAWWVAAHGYGINSSSSYARANEFFGRGVFDAQLQSYVSVVRSQLGR